jgi:putative inorganic carbon (hco3(-)) transporter
MTSVSVSTPALGRGVTSLRTRGPAGTIPVVVFFFVFYTNLAVVLTRFHGVPQIIASSIAVLLLIPVTRALIVEREPLVVTPVLPLVLIFLGALFLAGVRSPEPTVVQNTLGLYLTEGLLLYLLISNAVRTTHVLSRVIWTLILAGALMGGLSIFQELTQSYANDYGGFAQVDRLDSGGGFNVAADSAAEKDLRPRLGGPIGSENRYAQILAVVLPLALIRAFRDPRGSRRLAAGAASVLIAGGIFLTFSRGAAVAVAVTLLMTLLLRELKLRNVLPALAVLTAIVFFVVPDYVIRLSSLEGVTALSSTSTGSDSTNRPDSALVGRETENLAALHTFIDHPVTGVGPGVYFAEYSRDYANRLGLRYLGSERRGHSLYLELTADTGIIGLTAFIAMVGVPLVLLFRSARYWRDRDPERAIIASSFLFALIAYLASAMFLHLSYQRYFWAVLALASAALWVLRRDQADGPSQREAAAAAGSETAAFAPS